MVYGYIKVMDISRYEACILYPFTRPAETRDVEDIRIMRLSVRAFLWTVKLRPHYAQVQLCMNGAEVLTKGLRIR